MPEEAKEIKAKKLAAARKKLKEYQKRNGSNESHKSHLEGDESTGSLGNVSRNMSEGIETELKINEQNAPNNNHNHTTASSGSISTASSYFNIVSPTSEQNIFPTLNISNEEIQKQPIVSCDQQQDQIAQNNIDMTGQLSYPDDKYNQQNLKAIAMLISEKTQLVADVNKYRLECTQKDTEILDLRTQLNMTCHKFDELNGLFTAQKESSTQMHSNFSELQRKLTQANADREENESHVEELQKQLKMCQNRLNEVNMNYSETYKQLEMAQLRIQQISDDNNVSKDSKVESLMQNQLMFEQQIRDLQAMVQQLLHDKEQASTQYQTYTSHLNTEMMKLKERNAEIEEECTKLHQHEQQLLTHVGNLEREIQKNINHNEELKLREKNSTTISSASSETYQSLHSEIEKLNEKLSDFEVERHEFQLKIKSQEDRLELYQIENQSKNEEIELFRNRINQIESDQPDKTKLLATMESDKIAASRAMQQNIGLKQQLDEMEMRFVQVTNDKADLVNKLDAEVYSNREMRATFSEMEERLHKIDEQMKFKDEEMIRLSKENTELAKMKNYLIEHNVEQLSIYEKMCHNDVNTAGNGDHHKDDFHEINNHDDHIHCNDHYHVNKHEHYVDGNLQDLHSNGKATYQEETISGQPLEKVDQIDSPQKADKYNDGNKDYEDSSSNCSATLPTAEAVEKLQQRFTKLISQVADLTDEKQCLEHIVTQLQFETETIGEYIALYQTQRRILKQREYEKAAQTRLLQAERQQLQEKITILNNLVNSLSIESPFNNLVTAANVNLIRNTSLDPVPTENIKDENATDTESIPISHKDDFGSNQDKRITAESQEIFNKIHNIISEIQVNMNKDITETNLTSTVDHLNCCLGKFEVV